MSSAFEKDIRDMLKDYRNIEKAITNMEDELEMLRGILDPKAFSVQAFNSGGSDYNSQEEKMFNYMFKSKQIEILIKLNKFYYSMLTKAFESLGKEERNVIEECFFKNKSPKRVAIELSYDDSSIYKIIKKAIRKIIIFCYGYNSF